MPLDGLPELVTIDAKKNDIESITLSPVSFAFHSSTVPLSVYILTFLIVGVPARGKFLIESNHKPDGPQASHVENTPPGW